MGSACCCFNVSEDPEDVSSSSNRSCIRPISFVQNLYSKYSALFCTQQIQARSSQNQGAAALTANAQAVTATSPPIPSLFNAGSGHSNVVTGHDLVDDNLRKIFEQIRAEYLASELARGGDNSIGSLKIPSKEVEAGVFLNYPSSEASEDEDVCPTCLEEYTPENPKIITKCSHHFHLSCIYEWMERSERCPVCSKWLQITAMQVEVPARHALFKWSAKRLPLLEIQEHRAIRLAQGLRIGKLGGLKCVLVTDYHPHFPASSIYFNIHDLRINKELLS